VKAKSPPRILGLIAGLSGVGTGVLTVETSRFLQPSFPEHKKFLFLLDPGSPVAVFVDPVETAAQIL
jgi:hypothetical protein